MPCKRVCVGRRRWQFVAIYRAAHSLCVVRGEIFEAQSIRAEVCASGGKGVNGTQSLTDRAAGTVPIHMGANRYSSYRTHIALGIVGSRR